jgi:hypothetical protein
MKIKRKSLAQLSSGIIALLLVSLIFTSVAQAGPLSQDDRPPASGGGGPGGGGGGGGGGQGGAGGNGGNGSNGGSADRCASLSGQIINWGVGGIGGIGAELKSGSWELYAASASDGNYGFGGLGVGVARLEVVLPPEQSGQLQPLIQSAGVYLNCDYPVIANIALFNGPRLDPPASIKMSGPAVLTPGREIPIRLEMKNSLPTEISNVIVTSLMPAGLQAIEVTAASTDDKNLSIIDAGTDGQLAVAFLDKIAAGDEVNVFLTVALAEDVSPGTQIRQTATLFYRESAADQDWLDFTVGTDGVAPPILASGETPTADSSAEDAAAFTAPTTTPETGPIPAALPTTSTPEAPTQEGAETVPPGKMPGSGGDFLPPPGKMPDSGGDFLAPPDALPVTGQKESLLFEALPNIGLVPVALLIGLGLGGLFSVLRHLRSPQDDE